jgi:hypothetical protein
MRAAMLCCLLVAACRAGGREGSSDSSASPGEAERVVQRGLEAWNKHDVEGALSVYSPEAKLYLFPDHEVSHPLDSLRSRWQQRFAKDPKVHVTVSPRIVHKNFVIDHENVTGLSAGGTSTADWIYQVQGGRIVRAWRLPD